MGRLADSAETLLDRFRSSPLPAVSAYVGESAIRLLLAAVVGILIARYLGPSDLGLLSYALSLFALLAPLASLGMRSILVREFSVAADWRTVMAGALSRQVPAALVASILGSVVLWVTRSSEPEAIPLALALLPLPILALGDTIRTYLEAKGKVRRVARITVAATICASLLKISAITFGQPIWAFALYSSVEVGLMAVGLAWGRLNRRTLNSIRQRYVPHVAKRLLRESWPLLLAGLAVTVYMKIDIAMLGMLAGDAQTGIYVAASRLSEAWYFVPVAAAAAIRPRLARAHANGNSVLYQGITQRFVTSSLWFSVFAAAITALVAAPAIILIYGSEFSASADVLRIHVLAAPFVYIGVASNQWFVDRGMTKAVMLRSGAGASVNVILNLILIPPLGAVGAAIATLISYALSGMLINGVLPRTRPLFITQLKAFRFAWH